MSPVAAQEAPPRVASYDIVNAREIPDSLIGQAGDPELGRKLYFDRDLTGCSRCHGSPGGPGAQVDRGAEAPSLAGIGDRRTAGEIRLWLVAPEIVAIRGGMPGYYTLGQRDEPSDPFFGEPRLSAAEIEHLVAYLMQQRDQQ